MGTSPCLRISTSVGGVSGIAFESITGEVCGCCITASVGSAADVSMTDWVTSAGVGGACIGLVAV